MMNDPLRDLMHSTTAFYDRFGWRPVREDAVKIFEEEVREVIEAAHSGDQQHTAEEAADVMVTVFGLCQSVGVTPEMLVEQVYAVIAKNDAKTHDTHHNVDGKIRRRQPKR
jgi:NTP pyrophosphatase (non-canonical NTP hydrolase)